MPASHLPPALDEKFADLATHVRRLMVLRGSGWLVAAGLVTAAVAMRLDAALDLPAWARSLLLVGWLALVATLAYRTVLLPALRPFDAAELAALVERHFPSLGERLTTLVGLNGHIDPGTGSRGMVGALMKEADQRTRRLNFAEVVSDRPARRALLAAAVAIVMLAPFLAVTGAGDRVRRFALPWYTPPADVPFRVVVSSGDAVVKRGDPVTLSAYLAPTRPGAALPTTATLVIRQPQAKLDKKLPMLGGEGGGFHLARPGVAEDFEYRVEAGAGVSDWHTVTAADPVALADGSAVTVRPPRYADGVVPPATLPGFTEFEALQFSAAALTLKFTAAPADAFLQWKPANPLRGGPATLTVRLAADRLSGTADLPVAADGTLTLVLVSGQGLRTEYPSGVRATPDAAPQFAKVTGLTNAPREARPDDRVPIELIATDDVRLDAAVIEYCVNGNEAATRTEPVRLPGLGTKRAEGAVSFALGGKAKEGESLHLRVRVRDNRSLADPRLGQQEAVFPPTGWAVLRLNPYARPLAEQEVHGQRDKVRDRLTAAAELARDAAKQVKALQAEAPGDGSLSADQAVRLRSAREKAGDAAKQLADLAVEADLTPALRPLAGDMRGMVETLLRPAEAAIRAAEPDPTKAGREKSLAAASAKLDEALAKLADLERRNEQAARARLDQTALRQLAEDQQALAEEAAKPGVAPDDLAKKQRELLARLTRAVSESELLKGAADAAAAAALREILDRAKQLADDQARLNAAADQTAQAARTERTADLARRQRELAGRAAALADRTASAARVAGTSPADRRAFDQAAERLTGGNPLDAVSEQEKAARELDRLAESLARSAAARGDKREAARQVARWQDDLRRRYADAAKQPIPDDLRKRFAEEQAAVRAATELLRPPTADLTLTKTAAEARDATKAAAEGPSAETLNKAADALAKLADQMPTAEQRAKAARSQLDQLRKEQDAVARDADEAARDAPRDAVGTKLDAAAKRQDALAKAVRQLDVPGQEARREAAAAAAERAAADLRSGLTQDVPASQQDARRQLDRLRQALDGLPPADEQAGELARLQKQLSESLPVKPTDAEWADLQRLQRDVGRRLATLPVPDAPSALHEAREAADAAEQAAKKSDADELRKKAKVAADAVARLAEQLGGAESDQKRAERLARDRAAAANAARQPPQQPNPEASAEAARAAQRQLDELEQLRAGKAQAAKKRAADALHKLLQAKEPDRRPGLQQEAADALRRLADEMARNGDRDSATKLPTPPTDGDELRRLTGAGNLPSEREAEAARDLAREQRKLRDAAAVAAAELAKGVKPAETDALGPLAGEQDVLAKAIRALGQKARPGAAPAGKDALARADAAAGVAADQLRAGSVAGSRKAVAEAAAKLGEFAGRPEVPSDVATQARDLADRQADLAARLDRHAGQLPVEAARQAKRQDELAAEAQHLRDALQKAHEDQVGGGILEKAAAAAKLARDKMTQATRAAAANRGDGAADARRQAGALLGKAAADTAAAAAGLPTAEPASADRSVGGEVRAAGEQMRHAEGQLSQPNGSAAGFMKRAAASLSRAAEKLGPADGRSPGGGGGGAAPRSDATLPGDVTALLNKPWGELPGDVRERVIQDIAAKYGEDYARTIKLYFEQLANRK
jgi:hypothetical protein